MLRGNYKRIQINNLMKSGKQYTNRMRSSTKEYKQQQQKKMHENFGAEEYDD